jgi:hypothetical protein
MQRRRPLTALERWMRAAPSALLIAEFAVLDGAYFVGRPIGIDARVYLAAAKTWLSGGDPWTAGSNGVLFAGPPLSLLPIAPFAWMSPDAFTALVFVASVLGAVYAVRRLHLPYWWLLFPPMIEATSVGSLNILVLAALLSRAAWLGAIAKTYAAVPLVVLGRGRQLAIALAVALITLPVLPWATFLAHDLGYVLSVQAGGGRSAWVNPFLLLPIATVALVAIGRRRSAWWATPVLWPASQFHYSIFALPGLISAPAAAILALPLAGAPVVAVAVEAVLRVTRRGDRASTGVSGAETPPGTSAGSEGATSEA